VTPDPVTPDPVTPDPVTPDPVTPDPNAHEHGPDTHEHGPDGHAHDSDAAKPLAKAELLLELPDTCSTPDGMCLLPNNDVLLAVPNVNTFLADAAKLNEGKTPDMIEIPPQDPPPLIMKITKDNKLEKYYDPPKHPETGTAFPFGMCIDKDGKNLFITDLQWFSNTAAPGNFSRVLRIPLDENYDPAGDPVVVIEGMVVANAVIIRDGYLYVSDTTMVPKTDPTDPAEPQVSGIFRVKLDEEGTKLTLPLMDDPHLVATMKSFNPDCGFGADGLTFDSEGNLYCGNFADGTMHKIAPEDLDAGKEAPIWTKAEHMKSCDGIFYDAATDKIYVADSIANAVQIVDPKDGTVQLLAVDEENNGTGGKLDQPCEVLVRGKEVIASNMDFPVPGGVNTTWDKPYTISVIQLP